MTFLLTVWRFAKLIPWQIYAIVAVGIAIWSYGGYQHHKGYQQASAEYEQKLLAEREAYAKAVQEMRQKQQQVITKTVVEYRDRIKIVKEKGDEIIKEVPVLVPMDSPLLAGGVRVLHDAAADNKLPDDPEGAARAADPVETSTLAATVAENYEACNANAKRLIALQAIVSQLGDNHE